MVATKEDTATPSASTSTGEDHTQSCHSLPCNIDFSGRAPVEVYFAPHVINDGPSSSKKEPVMAAQFRGRQLLATEPDTTKLQGRLLEIDACKARTKEGKIQVKGSFHKIYEWKHEHEPAILESHASKSRVGAAMEWCDVAHALHDPIPI